MAHNNGGSEEKNLFISGDKPSSNTTMETEEDEKSNCPEQNDPAEASSSKLNVPHSSESSDTLMDTQSELAEESIASTSGTQRKRKIQWPNFCTIDLGDKEVFYFKAVPPQITGQGTGTDASVARKMFFVNLFENIYGYMLRMKDTRSAEEPSTSSASNQVSSNNLLNRNNGREKKKKREHQAVGEFCAQFNSMQIDPLPTTQQQDEQDSEISTDSDDSTEILFENHR